MTTSIPKLIFGGAAISTGLSFSTPEQATQLLDLLEQEGIQQIDTAQLYGNSEEFLGSLKAGDRFIIDTKHVGGWVEGSSSREEVVKRGEESLKKLGVEKVNIFYLHAPSPSTPLTSTLAGINDLHLRGAFTHFGLSNFNPSQVKEVLRISKENNYVPPTVYQGNYNAVSRLPEKELFPLLREHNIAFYAYSPIAGGFLTKTREQLENGGGGRWDKESQIGKLYHGIYVKEANLEALDVWGGIANDAGVSKAELAFRWIAYHSGLRKEVGDGLIIGASSLKQVRGTLEGLRRGPLGDEIVRRIEGVWELVEKEAVLDNWEATRG
ncbi:putative aldehyde reductase [Aspergillus leporis]|uniref:Putative aldehyde reductase n=1 Tax=Aspergillus leporis TaxID=41062 RepID=A0A5N5WW74_9EURO|nr:putative aldehyde reductase [Aspergillus leporis]